MKVTLVFPDKISKAELADEARKFTELTRLSPIMSKVNSCELEITATEATDIARLKQVMDQQADRVERKELSYKIS